MPNQSGFSSPVFRTADVAHSDRSALFALWREVFGDDDETIATCLDDFAGQGNVYVAQMDGGVMAMLSSVPCRLYGAGGAPGVYFYALATAPAHRGAGTMAQLMTYAEAQAAQSGAAFVSLIPASPSLYGYYRPKGYMVETQLCHVSWAADGLARPADAVFDAMTAEGLQALRAQFLPVPFVGFEGTRAGLVWDDILLVGAHTAQSEEGYAVYLVQDGRLLVPETAAQDPAAHQALLAAVARRTGCKEALLTLPPRNAGGFTGGVTHPAAATKWLHPQATQEELYLRFAMDVVADSFMMWQ